MEYLTVLGLEVLTCYWVSARPHAKNQPLLCQRSNFNEWAQSAYLSVPIGDGIFSSILCIVHILHFFNQLRDWVP